MAQSFPPGLGPGERRRRTEVSAAGSTSGVSVARSAVTSAERSPHFKATQAAAARGSAVRDLRSTLSDAEIRRMAKLVTGRAPSDRTLRRWAQQNRIPNAELAEALERRRFVKANGGTQTLARILGRSPSAVRRWVLGRQRSFRGDANAVATAARIRERMIKAGMMGPDGQMKAPSIHMMASVEVRSAEHGYSYITSARQINATAETPLPQSKAIELAAALVTNQTATVLAIIEEHASTHYASFSDYNEDEGFHLDHIHSWNVDWH